MRAGSVTLAAAACAAALVVAAPAEAHRLRLFATVEGQTVSGYGFFVGGGRAAGAGLVARDAAGGEVFRGTTGADGGFRFDVARPANLTLTLDAGDGHAAETALAAERFAAAPLAAAPPAAAPLAVAPLSAAPAATLPAVAAGPAAPAAVDLDALAARLAPLVAAEVDRAVARQVKPLLEEVMAAESHIRFTDVLGGLGWIAGLVGLAFAFVRRRRA